MSKRKADANALAAVSAVDIKKIMSADAKSVKCVLLCADGSIKEEVIRKGTL